MSKLKASIQLLLHQVEAMEFRKATATLQEIKKVLDTYQNAC